jgi:hypothetical protein
MKTITIVALVAIVIILVGTVIYVSIGFPSSSIATPTSSIVPVPPETGSLGYVVNFYYEANPILSGQTQWINITITQGAYQVASVPGELYVNAPNQTFYQNFGFNTDAGGSADFTFAIAQNATAGTYNVFVIIGSLSEVIQNVSSSFVVASSQ